MEAAPGRKTCKMCRMEIPRGARKCPYCQCFQNRVSMIMSHPAWMVFVILLPMVVLMASFSVIFDRGEDYQSDKGQIAITDSRVVFGESGSRPTVAVLGTIKNESVVPWKVICFAVDFFDAEGRRCDAGQQEPYSYYLPAGESLSFKLSFPREFPEASYAGHGVRVVSAKDGRARW